GAGVPDGGDGIPGVGSVQGRWTPARDRVESGGTGDDMALEQAPGRSAGTARAVGSSSSLLESLRRAWPAYVVLACTLLLTVGARRHALRTVPPGEQARPHPLVAGARAGMHRAARAAAESP